MRFKTATKDYLKKNKIVFKFYVLYGIHILMLIINMI